MRARVSLIVLALIGVPVALAGAGLGQVQEAHVELTADTVQAPADPGGVFETTIDAHALYTAGMCLCTETQVSLFARETQPVTDVRLQPRTAVIEHEPAGENREQIGLSFRLAPELHDRPGHTFRLTVDGTAHADSPGIEERVLPTQLTVTVPGEAEQGSELEAGSTERDPAQAGGLPDAVSVGLGIIVAGLVATAAARRLRG